MAGGVSMAVRPVASGQGGVLARVVRECYEAVRDGRVGDLLALVDPQVVFYPVFRPGLAAYHGHDDMACLVSDMHLAHGDYTVEFGDITVQHAALVTANVTVVAGPGRDQPPVAVESVFAFRDGLISRMESHPGGKVA